MVLQLPLGSSGIARAAAAAALLYLHIGGRALGLVSGAAALAAPKDGCCHRMVGTVVVISMPAA